MLIRYLLTLNRCAWHQQLMNDTAHHCFCIAMLRPTGCRGRRRLGAKDEERPKAGIRLRTRSDLSLFSSPPGVGVSRDLATAGILEQVSGPSSIISRRHCSAASA